jgi:hypothetical protein
VAEVRVAETPENSKVGARSGVEEGKMGEGAEIALVGRRLRRLVAA